MKKRKLLVTRAIQLPPYRPPAPSVVSYNVGPAEIAARQPPITMIAQGDDLDAAIEGCVKFNGGQSLFTSFQQKIDEYLRQAYDFMLACEGREEEALERVAKLRPPQNRKRPFSKKKIALAAVELVAKPETREEYKRCSDLSCALIWAKDNKIGSADLAARVVEKTLKGCKESVREERRADRTGGSAPHYWLQLRVGHTGSKPLARKIKLDDRHYAAAAALLGTELPKLEAQLVALLDILPESDAPGGG